tara:strand:- start:271 stop:492 length:222 start_codon:yes stop_codon:yes gene_type:complete
MRNKEVEVREQIKASNDSQLKNTIADMKYTLNIRSQMRKLNTIELHALEILSEAKTKAKRFSAIKRLQEVIYK